MTSDEAELGDRFTAWATQKLAALNNEITELQSRRNIIEATLVQYRHAYAAETGQEPRQHLPDTPIDPDSVNALAVQIAHKARFKRQRENGNDMFDLAVRVITSLLDGPNTTRAVCNAIGLQDDIRQAAGGVIRSLMRQNVLQVEPGDKHSSHPRYRVNPKYVKR